MGFLRTVVLYNDRWHQNEIRANPEMFIKELTEAMDIADNSHIPDRFRSYILVHPSRHADDHTVFVHRGNTVVDIGHRSFNTLSPKMAKDYLRTAQEIVTWAKRRLAENTKKSKIKP